MCHTQLCFALKQVVMFGLWYFWMVIHCFAPQFMAHLSSAFFFVMTSNSHSSWTVDCLVSCLALPLFSFLGYNWSKNLSCSCYSPKWIGIVSEVWLHICIPPLSLLLNPLLFLPWLTLLCSVTHIDVYFVKHPFLCSWMYWNPFSIFSPSLWSNLSLLFRLFHISPLFSLLCLPLLPPSSFTQVVSQRFPQNSIGAVGSAMFLRFVNPAIVSPYEAGILDKKPLPRIERGLKLMSKVRLVNMKFLWCSWLEGNLMKVNIKSCYSILRFTTVNPLDHFIVVADMKMC